MKWKKFSVKFSKQCKEKTRTLLFVISRSPQTKVLLIKLRNLGRILFFVVIIQVLQMSYLYIAFTIANKT
jgi:hypothetical protein